jgi:hypothetical protein
MKTALKFEIQKHYLINQWHRERSPNLWNKAQPCMRSKSMTFSTPYILGHSRHGLFFTRWSVNPMLNLLKITMTYPGFEKLIFAGS